MAVPVYGTVPARDHDTRDAVLLLAALAVLAVGWLTGGGWGFNFDQPWWFNLGLVLILPALVVFGLQGLAARLIRRPRPTTLRMRSDAPDRAFVAPPQHLLLAAQAAAQLALNVWMMGLPLRTLVDEDGDLSRAYVTIMFLLLAVNLVLALRWVVAIFRDAIRLEIRPEGVLVVNVLSRHDVPWEAISAGPEPPTSRSRGGKIGIGRRDLVRSSGVTRRRPKLVALSLHLSTVDHAFLVRAINHYLLYPQHRAEIGTPEEQTRLRQLFAAHGG